MWIILLAVTMQAHTKFDKKQSLSLESLQWSEREVKTKQVMSIK